MSHLSQAYGTPHTILWVKPSCSLIAQYRLFWFGTHCNQLDEDENFKASPLESSGCQFVSISPVKVQKILWNLVQTCSTLLITSGCLSKFSSISHSQPSQFMCNKLISSPIPSNCLTPMRLLRVEKVRKSESMSLAANFLSQKHVFTAELRQLQQSEVFPFFPRRSLPCQRCLHPRY